MEGYIAEIRMFAANFAPRNWAYCQGQILSIAQNTALFSLLGTTFGGNGQTTFGLPDLRSRVAIGTGSGGQVGNYILGQMGGHESVTLLSSNLAPHNHAVTSSGQKIPVSGSITASVAVNNSASTTSNPSGAFLGVEQGGSGTYEASAVTGKTLNSGAVTITSSTLGLNLSSVQLSAAGNSYPVGNIMPSLGMNYVICLYGIFPSRN